MKAVAEWDEITLIEPEVVSRLMAQPLLARFPMEGTVSGHHKSPHRGSSVEFAEYRNYTPGDDIRRLDWRVYARTDRFYLKEFEAETNLRCYLILDCSSSMSFKSTGASKFDYARRLIAALAYLIIHQGDAAGLVCVGAGQELEIPPRRNPSHLQLIFESLRRAAPRGGAGLVKALHDVAEKCRRRALVIVVSDFFDESEAILSCFRHLRFQNHDLAVLHLLDRLELDFTFDRPVRFVDLESARQIVAEPALIREQYQRQLRKFLDGLRTGCHQFNAGYRQVVTDENYEKVLAGFLMDRAGLPLAVA